VQWAEQHGLLIDRLPDAWKLDGQKDKGGQEHHVFLTNVGGKIRYIKVTKGDGASFGLWPVLNSNGTDWKLERKANAAQYAGRLAEANRLLHDDFVLHAVVRDPNGAVRLVISQSERVGDETDESIITASMEAEGFLPVTDPKKGGFTGAFYRASDNTAIFDVHNANAVLENRLYPFDVTVMHPDGALRALLEKNARSSAK
jgi:hypothetical protein